MSNENTLNPTIKVRYNILYKNGKTDVIEQKATAQEIGEVNKTLILGFDEGATGIVTFGDSEKNGYFIRLSDVTRARIEVLESVRGNQ